ncbi:MAG: putative DNA-binding domain-containing protein [Amphiplicatus sp.]
MTPHDSERDARVYVGLGRAIRSVAQIAELSGVEDDGAHVAAGVAVYRNNVRAAYLRILRDSFPVVERLVGEEFFRYLAHEYFHARPASSPLVARYGDALPVFIESFEPAGKLPYLADVARLELAWLSAYHAAEATSLSPEEIFDAAGEAPERARFTLHPSVRFLSSKHPVHTIWLREREGRRDNLRLAEGGERVLLVRPTHKVLVSSISPPASAALNAIAGGAFLGDALDAAAARDPTMQISEIVQLIATVRVVTAVVTEQA